MKERQSAESTFLTEALIISASNLIAKIIGMVYRISLSSMLGTNIGIYTAAYSVYAMLYMVSTAGLPVAISRMVASADKRGRKLESKKIFRISLVLFGIIGLAFSVAMFVCADYIAEWTNHEDAALAMRLISPTLFFICISSALRGYYQGKHNMKPTAVSQFIEAMCKLVFGIIAIIIAKKLDYTPMVQASFAIIGITLGTGFAMSYLISKNKLYVNDIIDPESQSLSGNDILKKLVKIALPVTLTSSALYFSTFFDTVAIKKCLIASGVTNEVAEDLYSAYSGLTLSISDLLPSTLVYPIAISILPALSAALAVRDKAAARGYIRSSIRISGIIGFPCAFGLFAVARPCIAFIYGTNWGVSSWDVKYAGTNVERIWNESRYLPINIAANALKILAIGIIFMSLLSTTNALLQAANKHNLPVVSILAGLVFLVGLEIGLCMIPEIGIYGAPIASVVGFAVSVVLNFVFMNKCGLFRQNIFRLFFKPMFCSVFCGASAYVVVYIVKAFFGDETRVANLIALIAAGVVGVLIYVASMIFTRGITAEEVRLLPKGKTIANALLKRKLIDEVYDDVRKVNTKAKAEKAIVKQEKAEDTEENSEITEIPEKTEEPEKEKNENDENGSN